MAFRTVEISKPAEIHMRHKQLEIAQEDGTALIPLEDITTITCIGPDIRISTMALTKLSEAKVILITLDNRYLPAATVSPVIANSRHSETIHRQISLTSSLKKELWRQIIRQKLCNQSRALALLGADGSETIAVFAQELETAADTDIEAIEAQAAKRYFDFLRPGLNRRIADPFNSRLNYGYSLLRSAIARSLYASGFHPTLGIHHQNIFNSWNLADDLIEPFRPIADTIASLNVGTSTKLTKQERTNIAHVLHTNVRINEEIHSTLNAIDITVATLKRNMTATSGAPLLLPTLIPLDLTTKEVL